MQMKREEREKEKRQEEEKGGSRQGGEAREVVDRVDDNVQNPPKPSETLQTDR